MGSKRVRHDWTTLLSLSILLLSRSPVSNLIRNSALFSGFPEWLHHFEFAQHERSSFSPLLPECDVATMSYFSHYDRCVVVRSLSHVRLFATPWTAARQDSPSLRVCSNSCPLSQWCHPTLSSSVARFSSCPQSFPASGSFPRLDSSQQVAKVLNFSFYLSSSSEYSGLISFMIDWFDLLSVQRTLRSLL